MELRDEITQIKTQGMEQAAVIWETLENLPEPIPAVDVYKAACSLKTAEFIARVNTNIVADAISKALTTFLDTTIQIAGEDAGSSVNGLRAMDVFEQAMPLTEEVFNDASAYAQRQHTYDGIILLAASKMGKTKETQACLQDLRADITRSMVVAMFREALMENIGTLPEENHVDCPCWATGTFKRVEGCSYHPYDL
jgi:hypothetical protein